MSIFLNVVVGGLQVPAPGLSVTDARELATNITGQDLPVDDTEEMAKAVQFQQKGPALSTPESIENGEAPNVKTQPTQEGA